jgi:hypothetical protein
MSGLIDFDVRTLCSIEEAAKWTENHRRAFGAASGLLGLR